MKKIKALAIFNALSLIVHLAFVYFAQAKMLTQQSVSDVSDKYESLFTPAGMTFGIWGIIYVLLSLLCLYHIVIAYKHDKPHPANTELLKMGGLFILTNLASAGWLIAWVNEQLFDSVVLIFLQLLCLVIIHYRLNIYDPLKPSGVKLAIQFPLSIYLGWISIATIANTSAYLSSIQWDGFGLGALQWAIIMVCVALLVTVLLVLVYRNIHFGLVVAWGLYGIIVKRKMINAELYEGLIIAAWAAIGIILLFVVVQLIRNMNHKKPREIFPSVPAPVK